jgi:hypothetical protein
MVAARACNLQTYNGVMTEDLERAYVRAWRETGRVLEEIRWQELRSLTDAAALDASRSLLAAASLVPLPSHRRQWSGLVDLQARLHRRQ